MADQAALLKIVGQLYEAAADASSFSKLPALLAAHFDTDSAMIHTCAPRSLKMPDVLAITENFDSWAQSAYVDHYHYVNTWFKRGVTKPIGSVLFGEELVDEAELQRIEWYEYCQKLRAFHVLGGTMQVEADVIGAIGLHRPKAAKRFVEADRHKMQLILPHLQRTVQIQSRLATLSHERGMAFDLIERLALGIIFVGTKSRVIFANRVAERVLHSGQGLTVTQGRLSPQAPSQGQALERLIGEAIQTSAGRSIKSGGLLPLQTSSGLLLPVLIAPFRSMSLKYGPAQPTAVVIFSDPTTGMAVPEAILQSAFALTPAQARLIASLIEGKSLADYASAAGLSINTAKTQLHHVFQRTGHTRQIDLVRAIVANPIMKLSGR